MQTINWAAAIQYAQLVQIAEDVSPDSEIDDKGKNAIAALKYTWLQSFYGNDLATDISPTSGNDFVSFGFLAGAKPELVVAIRGTNGIFEWIDDARFLLAPCPVNGSHGWTEDGFSSIYGSLRTGRLDVGSPRLVARIKELLDSGDYTSVTIAGHSLGGALTTFVGLDVALNTSCKTPEVYSYASPRVGDPIFAQHYNSAVPDTWRIVNRPDLVPKLPPILPIPYDHVNTLFEMVATPGTLAQSIGCFHHLTTYLWLMGNQAGAGGFQLDPDCVAKPGN